MCCTNDTKDFSCCKEMKGRRFFSKKERIGMLEKYKKQLQNEIDGINEHIKEIEK